MKTNNKILCLTTILLAILAIISLPTTSSSTVGGPTYVGSFKYNKADESIYYTSISQSGRGCPPILQKISLVTEKVDTVFSCDDGEELSGTNYPEGVSLVSVEISKRTSTFKDLTPISLPKNNIEVDIKYVRNETLTPDDEGVIKSYFTASVYQNNKKIDEFEIGGCNLEQPFTFAAYAIPGFEKKIVLLSSTKSDCWEGGYTGEGLHVIGSVDSLDKTYSGEYKSENTPLVPNEATMVIFDKDQVVVTNTDPVNTETPTTEPTDSKTYSTLLLSLISVIAIAVGIILGKFIFKKTR